ncbi:Protein dgcr6 [Apophysomyces ossiformis]|uniref:Protein dgcr6 n=1 Tax=Apophysomyces ossiformis TaxID=679940 RepID=A0A8H7ER38_9FUNG|nr:Protein dgcr6 [Apophysomyces ossiformis]
MDINHLLSLLQEANQNRVEQTPVPAPIPAPPPVSIPSVLDLASIDQDVIQQVRQEYQAQHAKNSLDTLLDSLQTETNITPDVLMALGRMVKETDLLEVLRDMKSVQDLKEQELFEYRQEIQKKHAKRKDALYAKTLIGAGDPAEMAAFDKSSAAELKKVDASILIQLDRQVRNQQQRLMELKVPFFKVTNDPSEIKLQQKILSILQDMME